LKNPDSRNAFRLTARTPISLKIKLVCTQETIEMRKRIIMRGFAF
jgi:hypothetical protein